MTIQIGGSTVINSDRSLSNINSYSGEAGVIKVFGPIVAAVPTASYGTTSAVNNNIVLSIDTGNMHTIGNNYPFTLVAPNDSGVYHMTIVMINSASAGAVTFSNFMSVTGDPLTTINNDRFIMFITKIYASTNHCHIVALK